MSDRWLAKSEHAHARLPPNELRKIRFQNPLVCCIKGLPLHLDAAALRSKDWYGRFQGIENILITRGDNGYKNIAWITFKEESQVRRVINYTNQCLAQYPSFDRDKISANFAWNGYCKKFINKQECDWTECPHKHSWGDINSVVSDNMRQSPLEQARTEVIQMRQKMDMLKNQLNFEKKKNKELENKLQSARERVDLAVGDNDGDLVQKALEQQKIAEKENERLKKEINDINLKRAKMAQDIDTARNKIKFYENVNFRQNQEILMLKTEVEKVTRQYMVLKEEGMNGKGAAGGKGGNVMDDQKELELAFDKLEIGGKGKKNVIDYRKMTQKDIIDYIINLDNVRFSKYYGELKRNLDMEGDIDGECLKEWTKNDLERFGIHEFNDKQKIFNAIQNLINNQK